MNDISCPHCGQAHPAGARFCPVSGKTLTGMQACPHCGGKIREGWNICPHCGNPLRVREPPHRALQPVRKGWTWFAVAIAGLALLAAGGYLLMRNQGSSSPGSKATPNSLSAEVSHATVIFADVGDQPATIMTAAEIPAVSTPSPTRALLSTSTRTLTQNPGAIYTHAAQTVAAQLTQNALSTPTPKPDPNTVLTAAAQTAQAGGNELALSTPAPISPGQDRLHLPDLQRPKTKPDLPDQFRWQRVDTPVKR